MDDVTFGRNGLYSDSGVVIPGRSLMSMNALFGFVVQTSGAVRIGPTPFPDWR